MSFLPISLSVRRRVSLLLDTHVLLWLLAGSCGRFGRHALDALRDRASLVSAATAWEIAIKRRVGKLKAPSDLVETVASAGLQFLSVTGPTGKEGSEGAKGASGEKGAQGRGRARLDALADRVAA